MSQIWPIKKIVPKPIDTNNSIWYYYCIKTVPYLSVGKNGIN